MFQGVIVWQMSALDIILAALWLVIILFVAFYGSRYSRGTWMEYIIGGKRFPWWYVGIAKVSQVNPISPITTISMISQYGLISVFSIGYPYGGAKTYFNTRVYYRTGAITANQWLDLRFGGKPGAFLRGYNSLHGMFVSGPISLGMGAKLVGQAMFQLAGIPDMVWAAIQLYIGAWLLPVVAGIWGITWTSLLLYPLIMVMYGLLTYFAWTTAGGYQGIVSSFQAWGTPYNLRILGFTEDWPLGMWLGGWAFALISGWGPMTGWGVLGAKSEDDALVGNTFGTTILSWPNALIMIPMALATMVHFPEIAFPELAFGKLVRILLPSGLMGLFVGVWLTPVLITAQVGRIWQGGTFANDFYRRLVAPGKSDRHYIWITRISLLGSTALAMMYAYYTYQVVPVMFWWATLNAGHAIGGLAMYYWWRWGGWIALLTSLVQYPINIVIMNVFEGAYPVYTLQWIIMVLAWFPAMLLVWILPPSSPDVLMDYYRRTRPPGFWGHIKLQVEELERAATSGL